MGPRGGSRSLAELMKRRNGHGNRSAASLRHMGRPFAKASLSNHAGRASRAADLLQSKGFNVAGAVGAETYESEGGRLFKIEPPKSAPEK
jgi:hypothetical protein